MPRKRRQVKTPEEPKTKTRKTNEEIEESTDTLYWPLNSPAVLGKGTFGNVQIYYHHSKGSLFAGKVFKDKLWFQQECELVRKLDSENVIKYIYSIEESQVILFDLYTTTLEELINNNIENATGLSEQTLLLLIENMTNAMDYLINALRIVHRDVKPSNILYDSKKFVLTDFGLAVAFDPSNFSYHEIVGGTREFIHPSLLVLPNPEERTSISVHTELWPLAITFMFAAIGKHPFQTKLRNRWIDLALKKPENCLRINQDGDYLYDFDGYSRLSLQFRENGFKSLVLLMMKPAALFDDYFEISNALLRDNSTFMFDVTCCKGTKNSLETTRKCVKKGSLVFFKNRFVNDEKCLHPTDEETPIFVFGLSKTQINSDDIRQNIAHNFFAAIRDYFGALSKMNQKETKCVLSHAMDSFQRLQKYVEYVFSMAQCYRKLVEEKQLTLKSFAHCFHLEISYLFQMNSPTAEFKTLVDGLALETKSALRRVETLLLTDILASESFQIFRQNADLLNQGKFSYCKNEHVSQVAKTMEKAIECVVDLTVLFIGRFHETMQRYQEQLTLLDSLLVKTEFGLSEVNNQIVSSILCFSDK